VDFIRCCSGVKPLLRASSLHCLFFSFFRCDNPWMPQSLAHVTFLVRDYDEALTFFTDSLGFRVVEDSPLPGNKRWLVVAPPGSRSASLLLAQAATPEQQEQVGRQAGGRVFLFLHTDDFWRDYRLMQATNVKFLEQPRQEPYGMVAVFEDLYGNKWDLLQPGDDVPARAMPREST
jgi:catechol 2,3-dioxygenase-like lactoylglutathione lyase family enzyme